MAKRPRNRSERPSHPPLWLVEGLDIVHRKRMLLASVVIAVVLVGAFAALVFPGVVPRTPEVGAAIGLAALLLGLAAAVATDATDLIVRGPRHVAAAGGELVAVLPRDPSVVAAGPLATAVLEVREPGVPLLLALATAGRDARRANAWTDAIARALVGEGVGVLRVDLASGRSEHPGLVEVVRDGLRLAEAVTFEPGLKLAQLSAGRDHAEALVALTELPGRLPRDLDIMLVSLPTAASRSVVAAATALDHVLVVVERDRTSRVDLIASLDALEAAGTHAQAVLLDTQTALRLAPPVEAEPEGQGTRKRAISSTVGTAPLLTPGSDGAPVSVPDDEDAPPGEVEVEPASSDDDPETSAPAGDLPDDDAAASSVPLAGPLAAGVAGAGVAAGFGAVAAEREAGDDPDDAAPGSEDGPVGEDGPGTRGDQRIEGDSGPEVAEHATTEVAEHPPAELSESEDDGADVDDGTRPASEQRDLEVLEAAAAATAMSIADAEDEPLDERLEALSAPHDLEDELPQPGEAPLVEEVVELPAEGHGSDPGTVDEVAAREVTADAPSSGDDLEQDDPTDRLSPVAAAEPTEPDLFAAGDEDLLRTTAQLAILADDLELRGRGEADVEVAADDRPAGEPADGETTQGGGGDGEAVDATDTADASDGPDARDGDEHDGRA